MDAKLLRKQIKNVLQETAKDIVTSEVGESIKASLLADLNARLDNIDQYCQQSLEKQDKRAKNIQSFILQQVTGKIQNDLFNANVTIDAIIEVLGESGLNIEGFNEKIDAKKIVISERIRENASQQMQADIAARAEASKAAAAAAKEEAPAVDAAASEQSA